MKPSSETHARELPIHPAADLFPCMAERELAELTADIQRNGLSHPIVRWGDTGPIVDGRNRLAACQRLGIAPEIEARDFADVDELVRYIVSANLHRRHLNESQRAMVASRLATLSDGQRKRGRPIGRPELSQGEAAELLAVGERQVRRARTVQARGAPELAAAVEAGQVAVSTAAELTELPQPEQAELVARGEKEILARAKQIRARKLRERREQRIREIATSATSLDAGPRRYPIVYADPPWRYEHAESESRAIENHYPTMSLTELEALPVAELAASDCVLYLWATSPKLQEAMALISAWGFDYRTCLVWVKDRMGMGYWARQRHELLLVARRGSPPPPHPEARPDSVIEAPRGRHSAKPERVYDLIEAMYPDLPRIELFARQRREGWDGWGNQL